MEVVFAGSIKISALTQQWCFFIPGVWPPPDSQGGSPALFIRWKAFANAFFIGGQRRQWGCVGLAAVAGAHDERLPRHGGHRGAAGALGRSSTMLRVSVNPPPVSGTDQPLDRIAHGEQKQQKKNPRKFARNHGDVVVSRVDYWPATRDVALPGRAADLVVRTNVWSASSDGINRVQ